MGKLSFREKMMLSLLLCVAIIVISNFVIAKPLRANIEKAQTEYNKVESDKKQKDDVINGRVVREQGIGQLFYDIGEIEGTYAIGTTHENMDILFTKLAVVHDLTTQSFAVSLITENQEEFNKRKSNATKTSDKIDTVIDTSKSVELSAETETLVTAENGLVVECYNYTIMGSYKAILDFIEDLNKDNKIQIRSFTLLYDKEDEMNSILNINIYLKELGEDYKYSKDIVMTKYGFLSDRISEVVEETKAENEGS